MSTIIYLFYLYNIKEKIGYIFTIDDPNICDWNWKSKVFLTCLPRFPN